MKLYELTEQLRGLHELVESGELPPDAIQDTLDGLEGEITQKAEKIGHVVANWQSDQDAIDAEIKRLQARKKHISNAESRLKDYLRYNMEASGTTKISCPLFSITLTKPQKVVVIDNETWLNEEYIRVKREVDKTKIKAALKEGAIIPGAHLEDGKPGIRIG